MHEKVPELAYVQQSLNVIKMNRFYHISGCKCVATLRPQLGLVTYRTLRTASDATLASVRPAVPVHGFASSFWKQGRSDTIIQYNQVNLKRSLNRRGFVLFGSKNCANIYERLALVRI